MAVYAAARLIDEVGDASQGHRLDTLEALEVDLRASFRGRASHPVLQDLTPVASRRGLELAPFLRLVEANRFDQRSPDLATWPELLAYCDDSAAPIGQLVLQIFDRSEPSLVARSNPVCAALQVLEHCQDVAEDWRAGRIYLPREDRKAAGCTPEQLGRAPATEPLRQVIAQQVSRSRQLLTAGPPLVAELRGFARLAVAGFVAGGIATCDALERAGFDPNTRAVRPRRRDLAASLAALVARSLL